MKRVLSYLYPYRLRMLLGFIVKVLGTLSELLLPVVLTHILKNVVVTQDLKKVLLFGSLMLVFSGIACAFNIIANRMAAWVGRSFSEALRRDLFYRTLTLDATETDAFTVPSLESRITTDTYHVHNFVMMIQRMGVRAPILLLGGVVITLLMDAFLALVILAVMPVIFLSIYFVSRLGVSLYRRVQKSNDALVRVLREDYNGIRVIKALSKEEHEQKRFEKANHQLSKNEQIAGIAMGATHPIMTLLMNCGITAVVAIAALRVANHQSSTETVIAFMQYFTLISMALMTVSRMFVMYSKCAASAARISAVLETPDTLPVCPQSHEEKEGAPYIRFSNVTFAYGESAPCLSHISFSLEKGQSLGIIGATGSGKSTLIKLLLRFYDTKEGEIIFRGRPIKSYTREEISAFCGVSHQKNFLYAASVAENIRFGREIGEEALSLAARTAQAEAFILALAEGYQTPIATGGTNLSGGQRQRLMIARALAGSPELLILDDSSSALDYKTDAALRRAISDNYPDLTTVTVAQRVSSVMQCSLILVLDEGEIVGMGTHETLLRDCSVYREISASQIGGALFE